MEHRPKVGLDNEAFRGRLRVSRARTVIYDRQFAPKNGPQDSRLPSRTEAEHRSGSPEPASLGLSTAPTHPSLPKPLKAPPSPNERPDLPKQHKSNVLTRQSVQRESKKYRPKKYRRPIMPTLLGVTATVLVMVGLLVAANAIRSDHLAKAQMQQSNNQTRGVDSGKDGVPSEDAPPLDISKYMVAPDLPRFLTVDKLGIHARIVRLSAGSNDAIQAPGNIFDVGWYEGSNKPGMGGTTVLGGYISGPTQHGVFYSLGSLKNGDKLSLERGDGILFHYTVTGTAVYDADKLDMSKVMTTSVPGKKALNLITFSGRFNVRTNQFEQRIVVFTTQD